MDQRDAIENGDIQAIFQQRLKAMRSRFVATLEQKAVEIENCLQQISDPFNFDKASGDVALLAHKLRGTSLTLGMQRLGNLAKDLEVMGSKTQVGNSENADNLVRQARLLVREIRRVVRTELSL